MASTREIIGMPEQQETIQKMQKIRQEEEFLNDMVALLLDKQYFSEKRYMHYMEKNIGTRRFLKKILDETYIGFNKTGINQKGMNSNLIMEFENIIGKNKEKLLLILGINETNI